MTQEITFQVPDLPDVVPLLPMRGIILMPRTLLPVPIFDTHQATILAACIQTDKKHIGLVQPSSTSFEEQALAPLFSIGCLGEIIELGKTEENIFVVMLKGICRFNIVKELSSEKGHRQAHVSYDSYPGDVVERADFSIDRDHLLAKLKTYLLSNDLNTDWETLKKASNDQLLNFLSIICPFAVCEKQALLESRNPQEQYKVMTALMEMGALKHQLQSETYH